MWMVMGGLLAGYNKGEVVEPPETEQTASTSVLLSSGCRENQFHHVHYCDFLLLCLQIIKYLVI